MKLTLTSGVINGATTLAVALEYNIIFKSYKDY